MTEQGQAFYNVYCSTPWCKVKPTINERAAELCDQFGSVIKTLEDLYAYRHYIDRIPSLKGKGFTFELMSWRINDWVMERMETPARSSQPATSPSGTVKNEPTDDEVAAMRLKAAQMQEKMLAERAARKEKRA